jgi:hypothetical protein
MRERALHEREALGRAELQRRHLHHGPRVGGMLGKFGKRLVDDLQVGAIAAAVA